MTEIYATVPVNFVAVVLGDLGYMPGVPLPRQWTTTIASALMNFISDQQLDGDFRVSADGTMITFRSLNSESVEITDALAEGWMSADMGQVEPGAAFSGNYAEALYGLGYYIGPPAERMSREIVIAAQEFGRRTGVLQGGSLAVSGVSVPGSQVDIVRIGVDTASTDFYPKLVRAWLEAIKNQLTASSPPSFALVEQADPHAPLPAAAPPKAAGGMSRAGMVTLWGLGITGAAAGLYYAFAGKKR